MWLTYIRKRGANIIRRTNCSIRIGRGRGTPRRPFPENRNAFGKFLANMFTAFRPRLSEGGSKTRPPGYRLGTLAEARAAFAGKQGIGSPWPDDEPESGTSP